MTRPDAASTRSAPTIAEWMTASGVAFGTSGARGLVRAMTDRVCYAYTRGFLEHLARCGEFSPGARVALAGDLRPSTPRILRACAAAVRDAGGEVVVCGEVPTPALCASAYAEGMPSLMVTGSHIPDDRNGIKFNRARGEFLKADEAAKLPLRVGVDAAAFDADGALLAAAALPPVRDVAGGYLRRYTDFFGAGALRGMRLGVYQHSAVGRDLLVELLRALGAEVVALGRSPGFVPVDTEAVRPEDAALARAWAAEYGFDALLSTDGDSDRPLLADAHGEWLRGDVLGIVAARFLGVRAVATPVSSNTALELAGFATDIRRTRIGSPYVVAAMQEAVAAGHAPVAGFEANGGFLLATDVLRQGRRLPALPTRDAVLPMLCALVAAREADLPLSALVGTLPARTTRSERLQDMPTRLSEARLAGLRGAGGIDAARDLFGALCGEPAGIDFTDGVRMRFEGGDIVHLRPSGNAPELRVYAEADSPDRAAELVTAGMAVLRSWREVGGES
ncbi:phosphoglucomutase/phosphomannomutase alpha/beta/alpha domain I [Burkholderiales bacterium GJ-E10]|nr:phosphoglucomutase/phosphomannomutase alpha/beta/alpha domain I [Burkholderiales bacterium GJ-E10]